MRPKTILLVAAIVGGVFAWREYNRGVAETDSLPVKETVTAAALFSAFTTDEQAATAKFVGPTEQVIEVSGVIRSLDPLPDERTNVVLDPGDALAGVVCEFENSRLPKDWKPGSPVNVRGICTGMLLDIVLVRCMATK